MRLELRGHPVARMAERGVTEEQIRATLAFYDRSWPGKRDGRHCYVKRFPDGRSLRVVVKRPITPGDTVVTVVSVMWEEGQ